MNTSINAVYRSALKLMVSVTPEDVYPTVVQEAQKLANAVSGTIFLFQHDRLKRVYSTVPKNDQLEPRKDGFSFRAFTTRKAFVVSIKKLKKVHAQYNPDGIKQVIFIPLSYGNNAIGVITLDSSQHTVFSAKKIQTLKLFGSLASLKIRNDSLLAELQTAVQTRDLFISMASHELKTPLTAISAYAQLINKNTLQKKAIKAEWLRALRNSSFRMTRLINELLDINQIRTGNMIYNFVSVDPLTLIELAINDFKMSYPDQEFILVNKSVKNCLMTADKDKLIQVLINILNNAAKFTDDKLPVILAVKKKGRKIVISIVDKGEGIDQEDLKNLFQEFYKAKNNAREGLGLGLFISKKIIEAHKGKIQISSTVGKGTTVTLIFPCEK